MENTAAVWLQTCHWASHTKTDQTQDESDLIPLAIAHAPLGGSGKSNLDDSSTIPIWPSVATQIFSSRSMHVLHIHTQRREVWLGKTVMLVACAGRFERFFQHMCGR